MKRKLILTGFLLWAALMAGAHEFWIDSGKFYFAKGEVASLSFKVGDDFIGEPWKIHVDRILRLEHDWVSGAADLKRSLQPNASDPLAITLSGEGTHTIVMESSPAFIQLDGEAFSQYLQEDGLDDVLYARKKQGISGDTATELYSRHAKLFLQAGSKTDDQFKTIYSLPIEIIPEQNPASLKKGDPVAFKILYEGKPLFGAKVKVWNRHNHRVSVQNIFSQQDGRIATHISNPGAWMVSVVKMVPSRDGTAQYRSYWGTLVFGVR